MERRTTLEWLRQITDDEHSGQVIVPTHFTSQPTKPWTTRKVLRRMLEYERELTAHIREVLAM